MDITERLLVAGKLLGKCLAGYRDDDFRSSGAAAADLAELIFDAVDEIDRLRASQEPMAKKELGLAIESAQMSLIAATTASCTCGSGSLSAGMHDGHCRTLKLANALDQLDTIAAALGYTEKGKEQSPDMTKDRNRQDRLT